MERFRFKGVPFSILDNYVSPRFLIALPVVAGLAVAGYFRRNWNELQPAAWAYPMAVSRWLAPVVYPWYLLWLVPFALARVTLPLLVWSLSIIATYVVWELARTGAAWRVPVAVSIFEYGMVLATAILIAIGGIKRRMKKA